ncbi:hypothetical protein [Chryseobacterium sp.]|uniref:hypothetical protein n=1 Tax=Chryseobacterium sp. TaxID=1871047 RepID=UPI003218E9D6
MASWAEDTAAAFKDEAAITRIAKRKALLAKAGVTDAELTTAEAEKESVVEE